MSSEDRFGLTGDLEIHHARQVAVGAGGVETLLLIVASLAGGLMAAQHGKGGWNLPSAMLALSLLVVGWGWWKWFRVRRPGTSFKSIGLMVYLMVTSLHYASKLVADAQARRAFDGWSLFICLSGLLFVVYFGFLKYKGQL